MPLSLDAIAAAWTSGSQAHPGLALAHHDFAAYLTARESAWDGSLERAPDLYLACACLHGVPHAADAFLARFRARIPAYLGKLARSQDVVAEVQQTLAIQILVGVGGEAPRIGDYSGRGSLEGWVRIAAARVAQRLSRGEGRRQSWEQAVETRLVDEDTELAYLQAAYREPFRRGFAESVGALSPAHRALLRLHYVEGMTTARLAALHQVSRPTIVRRIADARAALIGGLAERLQATLGVNSTELESVLRLIRSQLDLSLARMLRESAV